MSNRETHTLTINDVRFKVIVQTPKTYQDRIVKYGWVLLYNVPNQMFLEKLGVAGQKFHKIAKRKYGPNRFGYKCDCEDNFYRSRLCKHISAFKLGEGAK